MACALTFEAAVAGGVPVIKTLREALAGNRIHRVYGILNGTCNYILPGWRREGCRSPTASKDAQRLGYAEADPTFDVDGLDTAHKLAILACLAFGTKVDADAVSVEGISVDHARRPARPPTNSASASSCSASRRAPRTASSSACIRPWCRNRRRSRR